MSFTRFELCPPGWRFHDAQARPQLAVSRQSHNLIVSVQGFGARVSVRICLCWCTSLYRWCDHLLQRLQGSVNPGFKCLPPSYPSELKDLSAWWRPTSTSYTE